MPMKFWDMRNWQQCLRRKILNAVHISRKITTHPPSIMGVYASIFNKLSVYMVLFNGFIKIDCLFYYLRAIDILRSGAPRA